MRNQKKRKRCAVVSVVTTGNRPFNASAIVGTDAEAKHFSVNQQVVWHKKAFQQKILATIVRLGPLKALIKYEDDHDWLKFAKVRYADLQAA